MGLRAILKNISLFLKINFIWAENLTWRQVLTTFRPNWPIFPSQKTSFNKKVLFQIWIWIFFFIEFSLIFTFKDYLNFTKLDQWNSSKGYFSKTTIFMGAGLTLILYLRSSPFFKCSNSGKIIELIVKIGEDLCERK